MSARIRKQASCWKYKIPDGLWEKPRTPWGDPASFEPDAGSINDAIERVREELRHEHLEAADLLVEASRSREERAKAEAVLAQQAASDALARASQAQNTTDKTIVWVARLFGQGVRWLIIVVLAVGTGFAAASIVHSKHPVLQWIITGTFVLVGILNFFGAVGGTSAKSIGESVEAQIASYLRRRFS
jgi:hypothetical protein